MTQTKVSLPPRITAARLRELVHYSPDTGVLTWIVSYGRARSGAAAGCRDPSGYWRVQIDGHIYLGHRLAWLYMTGEWPPHNIDHINGDPSDNRLVNLRPATQAENCRNTRLRSNNTSGFKGVYFAKYSQRWAAAIRVDGHLRYLGSFETAEEAHAAYCGAATQFHGEFARLIR